MLKKISVVMCAGLFAVALAACGKKDAGSSGCDDLAKKAMADKSAEMPKDMPADQKKMFDEMNKKGADLVAKHCKDDKWSADVIKCGKESKDPQECMEKLTPEQQKKFMDDAMKMMGGGAMPKEEPAKEEPAAGGGEPAAGGGEPAAAGGEPAAAGGGGTGLAECDAYVAAVEKYVACDKVPQEARDGTKQGIEAMKQAWGDTAAMPEEAKKQANDACKQAVDALKQGATAMGCEI